MGFHWTVIGESAGTSHIHVTATTATLTWTIGELHPHQTATLILASPILGITPGEYPNTAILTYTDGPTLESTADVTIIDNDAADK
jgi:hypothetical protein